ncbi:helix-turn-helix domain-containing protein [Pseudomonas sp. C2L12B]|nr:helix-turn-helix domain-containing protein [Pseudomonas typographi]
MSTRIISACWDFQMSPVQKSVLISLADQANDDGVCWPSADTISTRTCLSERAIRNAMTWLESAGVLKRSARNGRSTVYCITPSNFNPDATPAPRAAPASGAGNPGTSCPPPRQEMPVTPAPGAPIIIKEPSKEPSGNRKAANGAFGPTQMLEQNRHDLSEALIRDYALHRNKVKAPLTATAWSRLNTELDRIVAAGYLAEDAMAEAMTAGWRGLKLDWVKNRMQPTQLVGLSQDTAQQILDAYHEECPSFAPVSYIDEDLMGLLSKRWNEHVAHQDLEFWSDFFAMAAVVRDVYYRGQRRQPYFEALLSREVFREVLEGRANA